METRIPLLARELVAIHAIQPIEQPPTYGTLTTADTVVTPSGANAQAWSAAIEIIRRPAPLYEGRYLHRDFQPGNVLFDGPIKALTGVVDWASPCWGPADLDVAHCATNLAVLHGAARGGWSSSTPTKPPAAPSRQIRPNASTGSSVTPWPCPKTST